MSDDEDRPTLDTLSDLRQENEQLRVLYWEVRKALDAAVSIVEGYVEGPRPTSVPPGHQTSPVCQARSARGFQCIIGANHEDTCNHEALDGDETVRWPAASR